MEGNDPFYDQFSASDYCNGYLFNRQYTAPTVPGPAFQQQQQQQPTPYNQGRFVFVPSSSPSPTPSSVSSPTVTSSANSASSSAKNRWENTEVKLLIEAYKQYCDRLKTAKSSRGKKTTWDLMYDCFIENCTEAKIRTTKTLIQAKEKWRTLFDKYKAVVDNNSKTGRGRIDFEHFNDINEFMGDSDKVSPKFVKESAILVDGKGDGKGNDDDDSDDQKSAEGVELSAGKKAGTSADEPPKKRQKKSKKKDLDTDTSSSQLIELLEKQQQAMAKAEENDRKTLEAMVNMQNDAEKRHQDFMVAVLGKLGDMFAKK